MKKRARKLSLSRETLQNLDAAQLNGAGGAFGCGSIQCTDSCQVYPSPDFTQCGPSRCICPYTDTVEPVNCA